MKTPKEIGALVVIAIMLFMGFIYPLTLILGNQELSNPEISFKLFLFSIILIGGSVGTLVIYFTRYWWKRDNKYGDSFGFYNIGEKPALSFFKNFSPFQLGLALLIIFSSIFLGASLLQSSGIITSNQFTSTIVLSQQFSPSDSLLFSTFLIPISEEAMNIFVIGLLVLLLIFISVKYKLSVEEYTIYYFIGIPIIIGILARFWHSSAYPGSDISLWVVFLFWTIKALIILATGFVFAGIFMHQSNNFFLDFPRLFSSDIVLITAVSFIFGLIVLYFWLYRNNLFGQKKNDGVLT